MNRVKSLILMREMTHLLEYCKSEKFDLEVFEIYINNFNALYKKCDYEEQGEYHFMWFEKMTK